MSDPSTICIEDWAEAYITTTSLGHKLAPPPVPERWRDPPRAQRVAAPGRPTELVIGARAQKAPKGGALVHPHRRAELMHRFFHHELQAAELMAWAVLAFPDTPQAFRRGLLAILADEIRHANAYLDAIRRLGNDLLDFPVRDWFWERIPRCTTPAQFVATMGVGFEGANLDHTARYELAFERVGDTESAALQRLVHDEELPHVRFALHWLRRFEGLEAEGPFDDFAAWQAQLAPPLSPWVMRGAPIAMASRQRAGLGSQFLSELEAFREDRGATTGAGS